MSDGGPGEDKVGEEGCGPTEQAAWRPRPKDTDHLTIKAPPTHGARGPSKGGTVRRRRRRQPRPCP